MLCFGLDYMVQNKFISFIYGDIVNLNYEKNSLNPPLYNSKDSIKKNLNHSDQQDLCIQAKPMLLYIIGFSVD